LGVPPPACAGPLHDAAKDGNIELIEKLITQGADINEGTGFATPLYFAIKQGHSDAAELLIERGADVNAPSIGGTPLHAASRAGLAELVRLLLDRGADPNARTTTQTPLHLAARNGHIEVVRVLLARGADLNAVTEYDEPAIHFAAVGGHVDVINLLVEQGIQTPKVEEITTLLAAADLLRGKNLSRLCQACHSTDRAGKTRTGPPLWGVVGRPKASASDFDYNLHSMRKSHDELFSWEWRRLARHFNPLGAGASVIRWSSVALGGNPAGCSEFVSRSKIMGYAR
jgi:cytochrome c